MRCNPWRWLWGLIPIAVLGWAAVQIEHARIERDLVERTKSALAQAGLGWADMSFSGRDGALSGKGLEESEPVRAVQVALSTWGVRRVRDFSGLIDKVDRYEWSASRRTDRIRLNGLVPNEQARRQVIGLVKASVPNLEVEDRLRLARGAPPVDIWLGGVGFAIKQLAQLKKGRVELDVASLSVAGKAADVAAYRSVKAALRGALPPGITLKQERVTAPVVNPHVWSASREGDRLTLSGFVPEDGALKAILAAAQYGGSNLRVVDDTEPGDGEVKGWTEAAVAIVRALAKLEEGTADLRDTALTFAGLAESDASAEAARRELQQGLTAAFKVTDDVRVRKPALPVIAPYRTLGELDGGVLTLSGHVPTEEARQTLLAFAQQRFPGTRVHDTLQLGAGQQAGWQTCVETGLEAVARLGNGRASVADRRLQVSGSTRIEALAHSLPESVRARAGGDCDAELRLTFVPPPEPLLRWSAVYDAGEVVLSGQVAGHAAKAELARAAAPLFNGAPVVDRMTVIEAASENWVRTAREGLVLLAQLRRGEARINDQELTISGEAREDAVHAQIREALGRVLPTAYRGRDMVVVRPDPPPTSVGSAQETAAIQPKLSPEAEACQGVLQSLMRTGTIEFARGSAELDAESFATLQRLAEAAAKCEKVRIEVAGHTDIEGLPQYNQRLSERRAQAVVDFLAEAGVPTARMHAVGYGFARPAVPNTTDENKARNRRIEFNVIAD